MPADVKFVLGSGAGGGLVSWAYTLMIGQTFGLGSWLALPMCVILGTAAAVVAVYVVTPTDTSKTGRLIGYALLCGFLWKPVLDAGRIVITERLEAAQSAASVGKQVTELRAAATPEAVAVNAKQTAEGASELLRSSDTLDNPGVEKRATEQASAAVDAIAETSTANPAAATLALEEIKDAAEKAGNDEVMKLAREKIRILRPQLPRELAPVLAPSPQ